MTDVVVLVDPAAAAAEVVAELLGCRVDPASRVLQPPDHLLGARFLLDTRSPQWWHEQGIAEDAVLLCRHVPELVEQLAADLVATWVVWCESAEQRAQCQDGGQVGVLAADAGGLVSEIVALVLEPRGTFRRRPPRAEWGPFARRVAPPPASAPLPAPLPPPVVAPDDEGAAGGPTPVAPPPPPVASAGGGPDSAGGDGSVGGGAVSGEPPPAVIRWPDLSASRGLAGDAGRPLWTPGLWPSAAPRAVARPAQGGGPAGPPPSPLLTLSRSLGGTDVGAKVTRGGLTPRSEREGAPTVRSPGPLSWVRSVVTRDSGLGVRLADVGGRLERRHSLTLGLATTKGGVQKTSHTAGEGLVGDMALGPRGGAVAVVEANPDNADLALDFAVPSQAPTVRELVACLESGGEPPRPHVVAGTRLEVWPERRQSAGHSHAQVARLHAYLRATYSLVIVDFSNCLPDRAGGAAPELLHAWAPWVDVWVVPMDCSQKALVAAAESIDALTACVRAGAAGRTPGFVVPLLFNDPGARRDRRHRSLVAEFRSRGIAVVEIPYVPAVGRAAMNGRRATEVHRGLTRAWVALLEEVVAAAEEVIAS